MPPPSPPREPLINKPLKRALGFWEGATENAEVGEMLLGDLQGRGLKLSAKVLFIIDGGKGTAKVLKDRYGRKLLVQQCTIQKDRNLEAHLPKKYRQEAHRRFRMALDSHEFMPLQNARSAYLTRRLQSQTPLPHPEFSNAPNDAEV